MAKLLVSVIAISILSSGAYCHTGDDYGSLGLRRVPGKRRLLSDSSSAVSTTTIGSSSASSGSAVASSLDWLPSVSTSTTKATTGSSSSNSSSGSTTSSAITATATTTAGSSSTSSSTAPADSTAADADDPFSIFNNPAGQSLTPTSTAASAFVNSNSGPSSSSSAEDSSSDSGALVDWGSVEDPDQLYYNTMTWTTTYFNTTDDESNDMTSTGTMSSTNQQTPPTPTASSTAKSTQESAQLLDSTSANPDSGESSQTEGLESAAVSLDTPEAQAMYASTMAGAQAPADYTPELGSSTAPGAATVDYLSAITSTAVADSQDYIQDVQESAAVTLDSAEAQAQYNDLISTINNTAPDFISNLQSYQVDLDGSGGVDIVQASTSGFDATATSNTPASAAAGVGAGSIASGLAAASSSGASNPKPVTTSANEIAKQANSSSPAATNNSKAVRSSAWVFSDASGNSFTLEVSAVQQAVDLSAPVVDSDGMITYTLQIPSAAAPNGTPKPDGTKPNSTLSSDWVTVREPAHNPPADNHSHASAAVPTKLGVGSDAAAGIKDSNPYDVTTVGTGGAQIGPGVITGVGVSLAGAFLAALGIAIWYNRPKRMRKDDVRKVKRGILNSWGIPGKQVMPLVVATAGNVHSRPGSPARNAGLGNHAETQTVCITTDSEDVPTAGSGLHWFSCSNTTSRSSSYD